jgi:hypothetical protein
MDPYAAILVKLLDLLDSETWIPVECAEKIAALKNEAEKIGK